MWGREAGYLFARRACEHVLEGFIAEGGTYRQGAVHSPVTVGRSDSREIATDAGRLAADAFVFACEPWLGRLFPDVAGNHVTPTRQGAYYFCTPPGDARFLHPALPRSLD